MLTGQGICSRAQAGHYMMTDLNRL